MRKPFMTGHMTEGTTSAPGALKLAFIRSRIFRQIRPWVGLLQYFAAPHRQRGPKLVNIELTNRCNLHCGRCWFHGENGVGDRYVGQELSTEAVFRLIDGLSPYRPRIYLGGAEPLMRDDFFLILEYIKKQGLYVFFTTNGLLWDLEKARLVVALGADNVSFSIDGSRELHDREKGQASFHEITAVIGDIAKLRKESGGTRPAVTVNIAVTPDNAGRLKETIERVRKAAAGVDLFVLHHLWYVTAEELAAHRSDVTRYLGNPYSAPGAASHCIPSYRPLHPPALAREINGLLDGRTITSQPLLDAKGIAGFYSTGRGVRTRCIAPFFGAVVKPNGNITLCPDEWLDDFVIGNIRDQSFDTIWRGDKAGKLRHVLLRRGHFTGCKRCSWMYSF